MSNSDASSQKLVAAHAYAKRGWRVIPLHRVGPDGLTCSCSRGRKCTSKGKHPLSAEWQNTPPLSAADIEALWEQRDHNVGLATGEASGFWVLDIDPEKGGLESWRQIKGDREVPKTYAVKTGSGGWHFYFAMPEFSVTNSPAEFKGTGIDIRGTGGQVVTAPSSTDKGVYTAYDAPVAPAPDWLLEMVRPKSPVGPVVRSTDVPDRSHLSEAERLRLDKYAGKAVKANLDRLRELARRGWEGEPWNNTTFEVACSLLEIANSGWNAYTPGQAYTDVFENAPRDGGFTDNEVNKAFDSASNRVGDKARPMPESKPPDDGLFDFMTAPGVRRDPRLDPKPGGGEPTTPAVGPNPGRPDPSMFFEGKSDLLADLLAAFVKDQGPLAYGMDRGFWSYDHGVWLPDNDAVERRCVTLLGPKYRNSHVANVEKVIKHTCRQLNDKPDSRWMNFGNTMLDWRTGETADHSPDFGSMVQLGTDWDPDATCPRFDAWLDDVLEPDYVSLAWEMIGYLMMSGNPLQVAFLLYGTGGNGKGTLVRVIEELLGRGNVASESLDDLNTHRFSAISLFGKLANIAGDIDGTYQQATANFKKLTGEDIYAAERKFGDRFTFKSWAVPLFSANKIPGSADVSQGYLRRWVFLHFTRSFVGKAIMSLSDALMAELPGIARKAVESLRVLMERGRFDPQGAAAQGKEMFATTLDQIRQWLADGALPAPTHFEPCQALYTGYTTWAERQNLGKLKRTEFCHRLEGLGHPHENQGMQGHVGLRPDVHTQQQANMATFWAGVN